MIGKAGSSLFIPKGDHAIVVGLGGGGSIARGRGSNGHESSAFEKITGFMHHFRFHRFTE